MCNVHNHIYSWEQKVLNCIISFVVFSTIVIVIIVNNAIWSELGARLTTHRGEYRHLTPVVSQHQTTGIFKEVSLVCYWIITNRCKQYRMQISRAMQNTKKNIGYSYT